MKKKMTQAGRIALLHLDKWVPKDCLPALFQYNFKRKDVKHRSDPFCFGG